MSRYSWDHLTTSQLRAHCDHLEDMAAGEPGELRSAQLELERRPFDIGTTERRPPKPYTGEGLTEFEEANGWKYN